MKNISLLFFLSLTFFACKTEVEEPNTGELQLVFKPVFKANPMPLFQAQTTNDSLVEDFKLEKLEFFLSNIMVKGSKSKIVENVAYLDFANILDATSAKEGVSFRITNVPVGNYTELEIGVGLPDSINSRAPADYSSMSPLSVDTRYWTGWKSYILTKIEGSVTNLNDAASIPFMYHAGVNGMYQTANLNKAFTIAPGEVLTLEIDIDAHKLLFNANDRITPSSTAQKMTHSGEVGTPEYELAERSISNLAASFSIK